MAVMAVVVIGGGALAVRPLFLDPDPDACEATWAELPIYTSRAAHFAALSNVRECFVQRQRDWYARHATWASLLFRGSGLMVLLCGIGIPLLNTSTKGGAKSAVSALGLAVAIGTAVSSFFGWQSNWASYRATQYELERVVQLWRLDMLVAAGEFDDKKAIAAADQATRTLIERATNTSSEETAAFFERQKGQGRSKEQ